MRSYGSHPRWSTVSIPSYTEAKRYLTGWPKVEDRTVLPARDPLPYGVHEGPKGFHCAPIFPRPSSFSDTAHRSNGKQRTRSPSRLVTRIPAQYRSNNTALAPSLLPGTPIPDLNIPTSSFVSVIVYTHLHVSLYPERDYPPSNAIVTQHRWCVHRAAMCATPNPLPRLPPPRLSSPTAFVKPIEIFTGTLSAWVFHRAITVLSSQVPPPSLRRSVSFQKPFKPHQYFPEERGPPLRFNSDAERRNISHYRTFCSARSFALSAGIPLQRLFTVYERVYRAPARRVRPFHRPTFSPPFLLYFALFSLCIDGPSSPVASNTATPDTPLHNVHMLRERYTPLSSCVRGPSSARLRAVESSLEITVLSHWRGVWDRSRPQHGGQ